MCGHLAFFMSTVVQSVVAFDLVGNNTAVGSVVFAQGIAMFVLGPLGGAVADRWPKRRLVAGTQVALGLVFLGLTLAMASGVISIAHVAAGSLLIGVTFAFLGPARQAFIVELVPEAQRGNAVALTQVGSTASQLLGPALAGGLLYWSLAGPTAAYGLMTALYAVAFALVLLLPRSRMRADAKETHVLADVAEGVLYTWRHRRLRWLVLLYIGTIMLGFPYVTLMPGFLEHELGRAAEAYAFLSFTSAAGALTASLSVARYADHPRATQLFVSMGLLFGLSLLGLSIAPSYLGAALAVFGVGCGFGAVMTLVGALIVRATEPVFFGRVMALTMLAFGAFGLMGLPIGMLADALGERGALALMGCGVCGVVALFGSLLWRETDSRAPSDLERRDLERTLAETD